MEIEQRIENNVVIATLKGRLDALSEQATEEAIQSILAQGFQNLLLDLGQLEYMSSGGLRVVLATAKMIKGKGGKLVLCSLQSYVQEVFDVSGFTGWLPIADSVESGLKAFQSST